MRTIQEHQYVIDETSKRVAVILPIEEYKTLVQRSETTPEGDKALSRLPLFGALRHLGTADIPPEEIDRARRELWGDWGRKEF